MTLPLLPGYNFPDPTQTKFHKSQALVFENGVMAIHPNVPGIGGKLLPGQEPAKETISSTSIYNQIMGGDFQTGQTVPAWVAFGSQVLRFYGYFKEPIFSSQQENYRVRHVTILFSLKMIQFKFLSLVSVTQEYHKAHFCVGIEQRKMMILM